jgi:hypothetical protein
MGPDGNAEVQWIARPTERLGRFALYSEANDWITLESIAYFVLASAYMALWIACKTRTGAENDRTYRALPIRQGEALIVRMACPIVSPSDRNLLIFMEPIPSYG